MDLKVLTDSEIRRWRDRKRGKIEDWNDQTDQVATSIGGSGQYTD